MLMIQPLLCSYPEYLPSKIQHNFIDLSYTTIDSFHPYLFLQTTPNQFTPVMLTINLLLSVMSFFTVQSSAIFVSIFISCLIYEYVLLFVFNFIQMRHKIISVVSPIFFYDTVQIIADAITPSQLFSTLLKIYHNSAIVQYYLLASMLYLLAAKPLILL